MQLMDGAGTAGPGGTSAETRSCGCARPAAGSVDLSIDLHLGCCGSARARAIGLTIAGVVAGAVDALMLRLAMRCDGTLAAWVAVKGNATAAFSFCFLLASSCSSIKLRQGMIAAAVRSPRHVALAAALQGLVVAGRAAALWECSAAQALLLMSLCPLWAALFGRCALGDSLERRTVVALLLACAASALGICLPAIVSNGERALLLGGLVALATGVGLAALLTTSRATVQRRVDAALGLAVVLGNLLAGCAALPPALLHAGGALGKPGLWLAATCGGLSAASYTNLCVVRAPRRLTPPEVGLLLLLEALLAPLLTWAALGEPFSELDSWWADLWMGLGGAALLAVVASHELEQLVTFRRNGAAVSGRRTSRASPRAAHNGPCETTVVAQAPL